MRGPSSLRGFTPAELHGPNRWQLLSLACYHVSKKRPTNSKMVRSEVWLRTYNLDLMNSHHLPLGIIFLRVFTVLPAPSHTVSSPGAWLGCAQQHQAGPLHNTANSLYGGKSPWLERVLWHHEWLVITISHFLQESDNSECDLSQCLWVSAFTGLNVIFYLRVFAQSRLLCVCSVPALFGWQSKSVPRTMSCLSGCHLLVNMTEIYTSNYNNC